MASDKSNNRLGVNRKITKKTSSIPRPAPKIYKIHPSFFRNLVQELTGKEEEGGFEPPTLPQPKPESPLQPKPESSVSFNGRLQRLAPPPLDSGEGFTNTMNFSDIFSPSKAIPILSPGMFSFSPLTSFNPMEWNWPEDGVSASPASLEYAKLAQNFLDQAEKSFDEPNFLDSPSAFRQKSSQNFLEQAEKSFDEPSFLDSPSVFRQKSSQTFLDQAEKSKTLDEQNFLDSPSAFRQKTSQQDSNTRPAVPYLRFSPRCGDWSPTFALPSPTGFAGFDLGTI